MTFEERWEQLRYLQTYYSDFRDFYRDASVELLGFEPTDMQFDIADFLQTGPRFSMIQAQRGEAKTTITGCYAVWMLIHDPGEIILIVSAGGKMSKQVANWVISIINGMETLECLVPDKNHTTTRTSVEEYDVHHHLKGTNKSPSVSTLGVTANTQGYRASLLIADDVESAKNSYTELMREQLKQLTLDFGSVNRTGKIVYLGTPQTTDSIYNCLPSRGYTVRIWPGRFPTDEEEKNYGANLAPFILNAIAADGTLRAGGGVLMDRGQPADPGMMDEEELCNKELDQGPAYFNLQYMLDTELSDANRFPLKSTDLIMWPLDRREVPAKFVWGTVPETVCKTPPGWPDKLPLYRALNVDTDMVDYQYKVIALDPAGESKKNNDETGYAVIYVANGMYFLMDVGGIPKVTRESGKKQLARLFEAWDVSTIIVERNFSAGMFTNFVQGVIAEYGIRAGVEEVWSTGQKELRIIDALDPVIASHRLVVNLNLIEKDQKTVQQYPLDLRPSYMFFWQLSRLTRDRQALRHDDRLEAVSIGVKYCKDVIAVDTKKALAESRTEKWQGFIADPLGLGGNRQQSGTLGNAMQKYMR